MSTDVFEADGDATELSEEERLELLPSLTTRAELNAAERQNINNARVWAMKSRSLRRSDLLTDGFGRELHKRMFNQVWKRAGRYRKTEKNLGWEVAWLNEGVRNAFEDARAWLDHSTYPLPEAAVRLHHTFVAIHPWSNGNGRHARLLADILVASRDGTDLTWGSSFDIASPGEIRNRYITAIRTADAGDFAPLLDFAQS